MQTVAANGDLMGAPSGSERPGKATLARLHSSGSVRRESGLPRQRGVPRGGDQLDRHQRRPGSPQEHCRKSIGAEPCAGSGQEFGVAKPQPGDRADSDRRAQRRRAARIRRPLDARDHQSGNTPDHQVTSTPSTTRGRVCRRNARAAGVRRHAYIARSIYFHADQSWRNAGCCAGRGKSACRAGRSRMERAGMGCRPHETRLPQFRSNQRPHPSVWACWVQRSDVILSRSGYLLIFGHLRALASGSDRSGILGPCPAKKEHGFRMTSLP